MFFSPELLGNTHERVNLKLFLCLINHQCMNGYILLNYIMSSSTHSPPNIVRVIKSKIMRWAGHVVRVGEKRGVCSVLVGKPDGKRPLGRPRRRRDDFIKMDFQEVGCRCLD
jgi:hypothetical protein